MPAVSTFAFPFAGGLLIGAAAALLLLLTGRIAGISGIVGGLVRPEGHEWRWRVSFLAGLVMTGLVARAIDARAMGEMMASVPVLAVAGLLVGAGTKLGNGCTSGHGVCGLGRGSPRSLAATMTFMAVAAVVVFFVRHGGAR
jgi:uncharacterized membrane protein YedE/YeeE